MRAALITALAALALIVTPSDASAAGGKQRGPGSNQKVAQQKAKNKPARGKKPAKKAGAASISNKAPRKSGSEAAPADQGARASVAGQPVHEAASADAGVPELREVDDLLFPEGGGPSELASSDAGAEVRVIANGLPLRAEPTTTKNAPSDLKWMASLVKPDIPFRWDARLVKYLDYFKNNPKGRSFAAALVKRSGRFETKIRAAAKAQGVPEDLVWVALVESGMNPRTVSPVGAAGLWQFMPKAATAYGLRMDRWVDERLDPERSTAAGLKYLKDLHSRFGSWELALAAYNMGHGALLTAVRKYNTNDFWELSQLEAGVPYETALYVPKIVALAFVAKNKQTFGCDTVEVDPPEQFEVALVAPGASLDSVAKATGSTKDAIDKLNPQLVAGQAPPTQSAGARAAQVRVPMGKGADLVGALPVSDVENLYRHTVRWGESLELLAASTGTTEAKLRSLNGMTDTVPPRPGTPLLLPRAPVAPQNAEQPVAVVPGRSASYPGRKRVFYEVVWGDRIEDVGRVLGVTVEELSRWNNVDRSARLHGKMVLQAFIDEKRSVENVRLLSAAETKVLVVGTQEFFDHFEAKNGRSRIVITAKEGETLTTIAKRYGCSAGLLERINHKPRKSSLTPGEQVVVYTSRTEAPKAAPVPGADPYEDVASVKEDLPG
ncbi:MAG: transglycosylase SLT domain-containing protein [Polyangiaceae bacterium]|nr:transglycosylase SLT domain-containing protein [Polyangiaceae bacterium]